MIRNFFATEMAKLRKMNFTDKRQYIWEYYKLHLGLIALLSFLFGSMIWTTFIRPPMRDYIYIAWQASPQSMDQLDRLAARINPIITDEERKARYQVSVRSYYLTGEVQMDQALVTRFHALVMVGDIHALVIPGNEVIAHLEFGTVKPIRTLLSELQLQCEATHALILDRILELEFTPPIPGADNETDYVAISLANAPLLVELGIESEGIYLCMISTATTYYELAKALVYIFNEGAIQ